MKNRITMSYLQLGHLPRLAAMATSRTAIAAIITLVGAGSLHADPFFVDPAASPGGDGLSWSTAFNELPAAVDAASQDVSAKGGATAGATTEVWVKAGTFELTEALAAPGGFSGIQLYGGFAGTEAGPGERTDLHGANATVLIQTTPGERVVNFDVPLDEFVHLQFESSAGTVVVSWSSEVGATYYVQYGADSGGPWETVTELIVATDTTTEVTLTDAEAGFYQVLRRVADPALVNIRLDGFTLTGARDVDAHGGGLVIQQADSSVIIANSRITDNSTLQRGGGVAVTGNADFPSRPTFIDTEIINNLSTAIGGSEGGGGLYYTGYGGGSLQGCVISGNRAEGHRGGGIHRLGTTDSPPLVITNTRISNNSAREEGGGIFTQGPVTLRQSVLSGNELREVTSEGRGGAGLMTFSSNANVDIDRSIISGNRISGSAGRGGGGAIQFRNVGTVSLTNSIISGNSIPGATQVRGAAIYFRDANLGAVVTNNTFVGNAAGKTNGSDGGVINIRAGAITASNNIFGFNNTDGVRLFHQGEIEEHSNLYFGNENPTGEEGPIVGDPMFVSDGENGITGTWTTVEAFESNELTGRGTTKLTATGTPFAGLNLAGTLLNPNTTQKRQVLIIGNTDSEVLVEGDVALELGVVGGGAFKLIDYRLEEDSAAIGAADPGRATGHDFAGTARPQGAASDIGAFEFAVKAMEILSFNQLSPTELELVFFTPLANYVHAVEHATELSSVNWDEQADTTLTSMGEGIFQAVFPAGTEDRGFYRVKASPPEPLLVAGFEDGAPGWSHGGAGDSWEIGTPTTGPESAYSGDNVFATNLDGTYSANSNAWLRSPSINLTGLSGASVSYWEYRDVDDNPAFHGAVVNVLDAGTLEVIEELALSNGTTSGWELRTLNLGEGSLDRPVVIEFLLYSDEFNLRDGWYIDDVMVELR